MDIIKAFRSPPPEYSACAFWFWNGELLAPRLLWQMDEMLDKGIYNAFMHARAYLKTPYMGEKWFQVMDACVRRAEEIGFYPWLYDEYAWPSGTCGSTFAHGFQAPSRVLAKGRQNMAKGLDVETLQGEPDPSRRLIAACPLPDGRTMAFYEHIYETAVDYLNPGAIRDFLHCTHEVYKDHYGAAFGNTIPGIFFDEIYLAAHPLPWTDKLPAAFQAAYGYDLLPRLPMLMEGDDAQARQVRVDYYALLADLYEKAFFKQIGDWCEANGLRLTGHTEEDLLHHPRRQGDYFRTMKHLHIPGADCHDYRYRFPREISMHEPKYAVSVARLYGKPRAMSEAMGGAGWGCSLQEYKRGVNALGAAGINLFTLHGFYNDCEHQGSQGDWPASFFFQNPYWKYFRHFAAYIHRMSYLNSLGSAVVDVGLFYPIEEMAAHTIAGTADTLARDIDRQYHAALRQFLQRQIDIDIIDRDSLKAARVENGRLCAGEQRFRALILPSNIHWPEAIRETLDAFSTQGGLVLFYPVNDSDASDIPLANICTPEDMPARFLRRFTPDAEIVQGERSHLYISHRVIDGHDAYLLASTSAAPRCLRLSLHGRGTVRRLNLESGKAVPLPYQEADGRLLVSLDLDADEACWLLTGCELAAIPPAKTLVQTLPLDGDWSFLPLHKSYDDTWAIDADETELFLPLARFSDVETSRESLIRIRNTAAEPGRCGRHVSLWKASWLGRRVGWGDDADQRDLYFVKSLTLTSPALSARVCVVAVRSFTLYVNGREAAKGEGWRNPQTLDIADFLHSGQNLIAVHVHTDTPLQSRVLTQAEEIPPDSLASLLLHGDILTKDSQVDLLSDSSWAVAAKAPPDWMRKEPGCVKTITPKSVLCHVQDGLEDTDWVWAWKRGRPPLLPWGDLPLFGERLRFPRAVRYLITLPAGTARVHVPSVAGHYTASVDGTPLSFADGFAALCTDHKPHTLRLDVESLTPEGGLLDPISAHIQSQCLPLSDWRAYGLDGFSGRALYKKTISIQKDPGCRYMLSLGRVYQYAEIWVNGTLCATRVWAPYQAEITEQLKNGENVIAIVVANSAACERRHRLVDEGMALAWNRYWNKDNIDREPGALASGLFGPVVIHVCRNED